MAKQFKIKWYAIFLAFGMICATQLVASSMSVSSTAKSAEALEAQAWCWGTFKWVNGIATCSGAAYDCTHPCKPTGGNQ